MTKEGFERVCNFLEDEGMCADDLIAHMKAVDIIIDCALEFDYSRLELFDAFNTYRGLTDERIYSKDKLWTHLQVVS